MDTLIDVRAFTVQVRIAMPASSPVQAEWQDIASDCNERQAEAMMLAAIRFDCARNMPDLFEYRKVAA